MCTNDCDFERFYVRGETGTWPVRECKRCGERAVLCASGWFKDDWSGWPVEVEERRDQTFDEPAA